MEGDEMAQEKRRPQELMVLIIGCRGLSGFSEPNHVYLALGGGKVLDTFTNFQSAQEAYPSGKSGQMQVYCDSCKARLKTDK